MWQTRHGIQDAAKVESLEESMRAVGWQGAEIVTIDDIAITGVHRIEAAKRAGIDVPSVDLLELCPELADEWAELNARYDVEIAIEELLKDVPADVAEQYGIES